MRQWLWLNFLVIYIIINNNNINDYAVFSINLNILSSLNCMNLITVLKQSSADWVDVGLISY